MVNPGERLDLLIEKPAAGGRMIARHGGQVVFVLGAIPGERVAAVVERVERRLAFATAVEVLEPSADRRPGREDPLCGGCLYSHVAYARQLQIKSEVVEDAFRRLGKIQPPAVHVEGSPELGYRMRARLHVRGARAGFFREGTHTLCAAGPTGQLSADAVHAAEEIARLAAAGGLKVLSIELTENIAGDQRALHLELDPGSSVGESFLDSVATRVALTGCTARSGRGYWSAGDPVVSDPLAVLTRGRASSGELRRRPESFFQGNRYLLPQLVDGVLSAITEGPVLDLYAGVGLFSIALAASGVSGVTAVEGSPAGGLDLRENATPFSGRLTVALESVEGYLRSASRPHDTIVVDPPRTGISRQALQAVAGRGARSIVYVSCDPATLARDARRLVDTGYELRSLRAFDLFPNTPHVESLAVFSRN